MAIVRNIHPKVEIIRNQFKAVTGVKIDGVKVPLVHSVQVGASAKNMIPKVTIEIISKDVEFVDEEPDPAA